MFLFSALFLAGLLWIQHPLRKKGLKGIEIACFIVKALLIGVLTLLTVALETWFGWHFGVVLNALYAALLADALADVCRGILHFLPKRNKGKPSGRRTVFLSGGLVLILLVYGTVNAGCTRIHSYSAQSDKLSRSYTVAFVSDEHYGHPMQAWALEDIVEKINAAAPDFAILGGDITDEFATKADMQEAYGILGKIQCPTYFVFGNHDLQGKADNARGRQYTEAELIETIEGSGITILRDEAVRIGDDLILLGREDANDKQRRLSPEELPDMDPGIFRLTADHSPYETEEIRAVGADLQLSGHSHAGQLFPNHFIYYLLGYNAYGSYEIGSTRLIVSSGAGLWDVPLRTEAHNEIVMLTVGPRA